MRTKALTLMCLLLLTLGAVGAAASEPQLPVPVNLVDIEDECSSTDTLAPEHHEIPVVGDYSTYLDLDVQVLMVGIDQADAEQIMWWVEKVFASINIRVHSVYEPLDPVTAAPDGSVMGQVISTSESQAYLDAAKAHFGGVRPSHADVVYTMVSSDLASAVAGQADCVGGIAYPDAAFSVGEARVEDAFGIRRSGTIAAHEISHLLAAQHHFANCAQGAPEDIVTHVQPCTLMFNELFFISPTFSTLEAAVVRRWALDYLRDPAATPEPEPSPSASPSTEPEPEPTPSASPSTEPEPEPEPPVSVERTIDAATTGSRIAGQVSVSDDWNDCASNVPLTLQRKKDGRWRNLRSGRSSDDRTFSFQVSRSGTYRVKAPPIELDTGDTCEAAVSGKLRVR